MRYCCLRVSISVLLAASAVFGSVTGDESNEELLELEMRQREKSILDEVNRELHQHVHMSMAPPPDPHADPLEPAPHHHSVSGSSGKGSSGKGKSKKSEKKHPKHHHHWSPKGGKGMKSSKKHGKGASSYSKGYYSKGKGIRTPLPTTPSKPTPPPQPTMSPKPTDEPYPTTSPGTPTATAPTTSSQPPVLPGTGSPTYAGGPTTTPPGITYSPTNPPSPQGSEGSDGTVALLPYQLLYTIDQFRLPLPSEFETVGNLTNSFVNNAFASIYPSTLVSAETEQVDANFNFGAPVDMLYNTTLVFSPGSEIPTEDRLNSQLELAFSGGMMESYLAILQQLPPSNIFETTSAVEFQRPAPPSPLVGSQGRDSSSSVSSTSTGEVKGFLSNPIVQYTGIAVAAGAACFVIIVTGLLLQDKRAKSHSMKQGEGGNRNGGRAGSASVTGHTVELACSSNDSRSAETYSRSTTTPMALGHHQRSITMPQHQQLSQLGSTDSTDSQGEWEEIVQARHHTGSVVDDDDEDDDEADDDDAGPLTEHQLLHDVNLSST